VIELLLTLATPRKDCKEAAKEAMNRFKTLLGVLEASASDLCEIEGLGARNILGIKLIKAVADRYLKKKLIGKEALNNSKDLFDYLYHTMRDKTRSVKAIFLEQKQVIAAETLFEAPCGEIRFFRGRR
jgi:DNA repair protein RadC